MSSSCVAIHLAAEEQRGAVRVLGFLQQCAMEPFRALEASLDWRRYVDDTLASSKRLCSACIADAVNAIYAERISLVYKSPNVRPTRPEVFEWLDLSLWIGGNNLLDPQKSEQSVNPIFRWFREACKG